MTGEITLSGRVLPVGGIKEKFLAAHRYGVKTIIMPAKNEQDLEELPANVRAKNALYSRKTYGRGVKNSIGGLTR